MPPHIVNQDRVKPFPTEAAFEEWLAAHHASEKEVWIRIYKKGAGVPTITPVQAIDVALCWGWIDGVRKGLDETSFLQRYTPRRAKSVWSQINRDNVARLTAAGRMTPHGQRHVELAQADGRLDAAYAPMRNTTESSVPADLRAAIDADPRALETFKRLGRPSLFELAFKINGMKTIAGRAKKVAELVALLAAGGTIVPERIAPERPLQEGTLRLPERPAPGALLPKRLAQANTKPAEGEAAAPQRPARAKAKPVKGKAAAPKRPAKAKAKAKPVKGKAAAPKRPAKAKAKAKPVKGKAAAPKRPAKATRAASSALAAKGPRKAKTKAKAKTAQRRRTKL